METDQTPDFPDGVLTSNRKKDAIALLGGTSAAAARALGYTTRQAMYEWPEQLDMSRVDQVNGALLRIGRIQIRRKRKTKPVEGA